MIAPPHNILIVNAYGWSNRGDSALLEACLQDVKSVFPDARITCATFEPAADAPGDIAWSERIGNARRGGAFGKGLALLRLACAWLVVRGLKVFAPVLPHAQRRTLDAMHAADLVISAPGGYIHDTNFSYRVALAQIDFASALGVPVVLAPQSLGPVRTAFGRRRAAATLKAVEAVCVREEFSRRFAQKDLALGPTKIVSTGDMAFWEDEGRTSQAGVIDGLKSDEPFVAMTTVEWRFPGATDAKRLQAAYIASMARIADEIYDRFGLRTVILNQVTDDIATAQAVRACAASPVLVDTAERSTAGMRAVIGKSRLMVGARFHSCIFALAAGRPTIAISYLPKTEHIMADLGLSCRTTPIEAIDVDHVLEVISQDLEDLDAASAVIAQAVRDYRGRHVRFRDVLRNVTGLSAQAAA